MLAHIVFFVFIWSENNTNFDPKLKRIVNDKIFVNAH